jgi:hypothetical protein
MKRFIGILILGASFMFSYSQDKIVRISGEGIECKITKEDSSRVYFTFEKDGKEIETLIDRSQVKEIIYEKQAITEPIFYKKELDKYVYYQNGNKLQKEDLIRILKSNNQAYTTYSNAHETNIFANILACAGGLLVGWPVGGYIANGKANWNLALIGGGIILVATPLSYYSISRMNHAVDIYNNGIKSSSIMNQELRIGLTSNGVGIQLNF